MIHDYRTDLSISRRNQGGLL